MSEEFLVVRRNDGTTDVFLTEPGKGFRLFDMDGRLTDAVCGYSEAIRGWIEMHLRPTMGEAFADLDRPLPCPECGDDRVGCGPVAASVVPAPFRVECRACGHAVNGVTRRDALIRWNTRYGNSLKTTQNSQKSPERGL